MYADHYKGSAETSADRDVQESNFHRQGLSAISPNVARSSNMHTSLQ